jgi:hypothetical protein
MDRRPDWKPRLIEWLASIARTPFEVGKHDCALFVAGAINAMTGEDPAARFRGRYTTVRGGLRVIRAEGFNDPVEMIANRLEEVAPLMAQVGDIAVVDTPEGPALGVVAGAEILVLGLDGLGAVSLLEGKRAFKLPSGGA